MHHLRLALVLALAGAACRGATGAPTDGPAAGGEAEAAAPAASIEWKDSWQDTYRHNVRRWRDTLEESGRASETVTEAEREAAEAARDVELARRLRRLLRALADRFTPPADEAVDAYRRAADDLADLGYDVDAADRLVAVADDFPRRPLLQAACLEAAVRILAADERWRLGKTERGLARRAADRLVALHDRGALSAMPEAAAEAYRLRITLAVGEGRTWHAARALDALGDVTGRDDNWHERRIDFLMALGRNEAARTRLQNQAERLPGHFVRHRLKRLEEREVTPPDFPRDLGLEMKWAAIRSRAGAADTARLQSLIDEAAKADGTLPSAAGGRAAAWRLLDDLLAAEPADTRAALHNAQDGPAREALNRLDDPSDPQAVTEVFRRYPWASATHEAMLAVADALLREGHAGRALRFFRDVRARAAQAPLRERAQAGVWLATAQETRDPEAVRAAFQGVDPSAAFPLLGERHPASAIRDRLLAGLPEPAPGGAPPAEAAYRLLRVPAVRPWPMRLSSWLPGDIQDALPAPLGSLQTAGGRVLLAGPAMLACYGEDISQPAWWRAPAETARRPRRLSDERERGGRSGQQIVPGLFRPCVRGGRLYTRWGFTADGDVPRGLAAFDLATGEVLWSTDDRPDWEGMLPVGDPAVRDGRLYVLAIQEEVGPILPIHLVCLNAQDGRLVWRRALGSNTSAVGTMDGWPFRGRPMLEVVRFGNAVTVRGGAVYCSTNLGFAARCDARDGLVEWVRPYARVQIGAAWRSALRRQGSAPVLADGRALFLPRDAAGVFALDAESGRPLWEAPFVPADQAVGMAGDVFVCAARDTLFGLDTATGRVAWHRRLPDAIRDRPSLDGGRVCVTAGARTWWLDGRAGEVLAEQALPAASDPPLAAVCRGDAVVAVSSASAAGRDRPPAGRSGGRPFALPVSTTADLPRSGPWLWMPAGGDDPPARLYLESNGVLECVGATPDLPVRWQRFLAPGVRHVLAARDLLVLAYDRRLVALDAGTGEVRYRLPLTIHVDRMKQADTDLAVLATSDGDRRGWCGVIDLAAGRVRWARPLPGRMSCERGGDFVLHGDTLHLLGRDRGDWRHVRLRRADGRTLGTAVIADKDRQPRDVLAADAAAFWVTRDGDLYRTALDESGGEPERVEKRADSPFTKWPNFQRRDRVSLARDGPWLRVQVRRHSVPEPEGSQHWILRTDDPDVFIEREGQGRLRGNVLYSTNACSLTILDLERRTEVTCEVPGPPSREVDEEILDFRLAGNRLWVLSRRRRDRGRRMVAMRLDVFDAGTGRHIEGQIFRNLYPRHRRDIEEDEDDRPRRAGGPAVGDLVWTPEALFLADARGLHALAPGAVDTRSHSGRVLVPRADRPVTVDGRTDDWNEAGAMALTDSRGGRGRLYLLHGQDRLWLAVATADPSLLPAVGAGDAGGGDRLEVGLTVGEASYRWQVGMDARGRVRCRNLAARPLPAGMEAAMRHDLRRREVVWEVEVPLEKPRPHRPIPTEAGLSLAVWDDCPADGGAVRTLTWGSAVAGRAFLPGGHRPLVLRPLTQRASLAMERIVDAAPTLPAALAYFEETAERRARSARDLLDAWAGFIRAHPESTTVGRLLALDRALHVRGMPEPREAVLAMARDAGVAETVTRRYARQGAAYLSQWVYVPDTRKYPRSIAVRLYDGTGRPDGWGPRAYWIKTSWHDDVPSAYLPGRFPARQWHEVRLPLSLLGMADRPISGIRFRQQGEPSLVWDRSAVVAGEHERVFVDDDVPPRAVLSPTWRWLETPAHSGARAHRGEAPGERYNVVVHEVRGQAPVTVHLERPEDPPYLSQWVYLDPDRPPTSVSIGLYNGEAWAGHAVWGEPAGRGRYMGPLPEAGAWHELRLPMDWTPLAEAAVEGVYFGTYGGRAVWDRTVLVGPGGERVLVDDAMPAQPEDIPRAWTPWADEAIGGATLVPGKDGLALACDGRTGYVEVPHSTDLEPKHLTIEAWVRLTERPTGHDTRRWLVNKNGNEQTEGHYALMIDRKRAGAYLHIGADEKADKFEAWDNPETLALNQWHHLAMTYDGQDLKVYRNGRLVAETHVGRERVPGNTPLAVGRRQDGYSYFKGHLDGVCFWKRALSAEEIRARFEAGGAGPPADAPSLVAHWGFDDHATPADPAADWQWVEAPVKHGRRAHAHAAADGWTGHGAYLAEPVRDHLPYDPRQVVDALRKHVPDLGPTETAWRMFECMRRLSPAPADRAALCRWFLEALPDHPQAEQALAMLHRAYVQAGEADSVAAVDRDLADLPVAREIAYTYRRKHVHPKRHYIQTWQVLGPLPGYAEAPDPRGTGGAAAAGPLPQAKPIPVNLDGTYDGREGPVRWRAVASETGFIDLHKATAPPEQAGTPPTDYLEDATAYAVCWVHSETPQQVFVHVNHNDGARVWLNGRVAFESELPGGLREGEDEGALVDLPAGWSRLLVYSVNTTRRWWFALELTDPLGRGPAPGLAFQATPPEGDG